MRPVAKNRLVCLSRDSHVRVFEIVGKELKEVYCTVDTVKVGYSTTKVLAGDQTEAKSIEARLIQMASKIPFVLTCDGTYFLYRSKASALTLINLEDLTSQELIEDKTLQKADFICYSGGVVFWIWQECSQHTGEVGQLTHNMEAWDTTNEKRKCPTRLNFYNIKLRLLKEIVDRHSLLLYFKQNSLCLMSLDGSLKKMTKTELALEDKLVETPTWYGNL